MAKVETIDDYLATLDGNRRAALEKLRKDVRSIAPKAEECISYGVPTFKLGGKMLVSFGAAKKHCSFYPGALPIETHQSALKAYSLSKGTVRFSADDPLPTALVQKLVKTRIAQRAAKKPATAPK